jgi:hypothetical protein
MNNPFLRSSVVVGLCVLVLVVSAFFVIGCSEKQDLGTPSPVPGQSSLKKLTLDDPEVQAVIKIQNSHTPDIMTQQNVVGTATGLTEDGRVAVIVYLENEPQSSGKGKVVNSVLPTELDGVPVITEVIGKVHIMAAHTAKQTPPIQLGTSGGWRYDLANGYCCGGTLGSLVKIGTIQYVLSNYHVFRSDIVSGGNGRVATNGDPIIQPGLIDVACNAATAQNVATLAGSASLPGSNVDCAIAQVISGMVSSNGAILEIGTISSSTVSASIGQAVKKSGRTTGLSRSTVSGLNATVSVAYDNECAGGAAFTKTYTGQIVIKNSRSRFLNSGDSGSLMVEDVATNPRAVGLLFAGSSTSAIANPIGQVLSFLGATMVGQ